jgi:hypothetical protein
MIVASALVGSAFIALASVSSYVWIGTQGVVARGLFGIFTTQQSRREPVSVRARWSLLDRFCDVGAVSVRFASGKRVFVPFVQNPGELEGAAEQPLRERPPRPVPDEPMGVEAFNAKMMEFAKMLEEEDARADSLEQDSSSGKDIDLSSSESKN